MNPQASGPLPGFTLHSPGGFVAPVPAEPPYVVYLHGFRSSPQSIKAQKTWDMLQAVGWGHQVWIPQLPASPAQAMALIWQGLQSMLGADPKASQGNNVVLLGSSLGGYYATVLAEQLPKARVVLLNPAIKPYDDLVSQLGRQTLYFSDEEIDFVPAYLQELRDMEHTSLTAPERYLLIAAQGDEVLSFDDMVARYPGAHQCRIAGSDHALSEYDQWLPLVQCFVGAR